MIVEPDAEVVQSYPRRQTSPQTLKLMGPLPPQTEGIEEFVVDALYDLADGSHPTPESLGPRSATVAFGRMDDLSPIALEPSFMIFCTFEALVRLRRVPRRHTPRS